MPRDISSARPFRWTRFLLRTTLLFLGLWVVATTLAKILENDLVFPGEKASEVWFEPSDPKTQDVWLTSADGTPIHAWYLPCEDSRGAILYNHGNGGNVSHRDGRINFLRDKFQRSILVYDYPGYGKSGGEPTEATIVASGDAALTWLTEKHQAESVILFGESLGGGVAVDLAARHECQGVLLFSTFESLPKAAKNRFPLLPCETLMANRFESVPKISRVCRPVYIAHGDADEVIPLEQSQRLFEAANAPKKYRLRPGATHGSPFDPEVCEEARKFIETEAPPRAVTSR